MRPQLSLLVNFASHALNIVIGFGVVFACTRLLSADHNGELRYVMTLLPLFMACSLPGYDSIILRTTAIGRPVSLFGILRVRMLAGAAGGAVLIVATCFLQAKLSSTLFFFLLVTAVLLPFYETGTGFRNYLIATRLKEKGIALILFSRLGTVFLLLVGFSGIVALGVDKRYLYPAYLGAMIIPTLIIAILVVKRQKKSVRSNFPGASLHIKAAFFATLAGAIYTFGFSLDKLLVRDLGAPALARYAILVMIPLELARLLDATIPLFYKRLFVEKKVFSLRHRLIGGAVIMFIYCSYVSAFQRFSAYAFGADYSYSLVSVGLSGILGVGLAYEYFMKHRIFAKWGATSLAYYSAGNVAVAACIFPYLLARFGIDGLLVGVFIKQVTVANCAMSIGSIIEARKLRQIPS